MADGARKLVRRVHEAAIAIDGQHRHIASRVLRAERGRIAPAEIVLIARREKGARLVDGEGEARRKADLRHLVHEDTVFGQLGSDRFKDRKLWREYGKSFAPSRLPLVHLVFARFAFLRGER